MKEIGRKSLLYRNEVEYANYCINHILGCAYGCKYPCYAQMLKMRARVFPADLKINNNNNSKRR